MSDSKTNETEARQTTWQAIVLDLIILILIMGGIGAVLKVAMDACAVKSPIENLTATIRKGDVDDLTNKDTVFLTELGKGLEQHEDFINLRDDTDRTPLMWACYANSIDPKEVADIDMTRLYYVRQMLSMKDGTLLYMKDGVVQDMKDARIPEGDAATLGMKKGLLVKVDDGMLISIDGGVVLYEIDGNTRKLVTSKGIDIAAEDENGFSALHWAAWSGLEGVALELIAHGLDVNKPENNGYTPLMLAAMRGQASTVKMLLSLGANAAAKNKDGRTALELAISHEKAYAANESGLYEAVTGKKGALFYIPIYEEGRSKAHSESVKLLQNPPAASTVEELLKQLATREEKARAERLKEKAENKGEAAPAPLPVETAPEEQVPAAGVAEEPQTA